MPYLVVLLLALIDTKVEALHQAARAGDAAKVAALLDQGVAVDARSTYGMTALAFAADRGHLAVVELLLARGADPNASDHFYRFFTPLALAASKGHAKVVAVLLKKEARGTDMALNRAVDAGYVDVAKILLESKKVSQATLDSLLTFVMISDGGGPMADLLRQAGAKMQQIKHVAVAPKMLQEYVGEYRNADGFEIAVGLKGDRLTLSIEGQFPQPTVALDEKTFQFVAMGQGKVEFLRTEGKVTALKTRWGQGVTEFLRVDRSRLADRETRPVVEDVESVSEPRPWPSFRGPGATGIADGQHPPIVFDAKKPYQLAWKTPIPGLGHSCPVIWGDRIFLTTAISSDPKSVFRAGQYGNVDAVKDVSRHTWKVLALDRNTGKIVWEHVPIEAVPKVKRHTKGSHANSTPATDGKHVAVIMGSEGLFCYTVDGKLAWKKDLGPLDSGWFFDPDYQWGFGSSPILYQDMVIVQVDVQKDSYLAAYSVSDGRLLWRTPRDEIPTWGTPTICEGNGRVVLATNGTRFARGYDPLTGKELWRLGGQSEITVPTPFLANDLIIVASGYRPIRPIYAVKLTATGDITLKSGETKNDHIAWSHSSAGPYMPTPLAYRGCLYALANNGVLACYDLATGKQHFRKRITGARSGFTASPIAADGRLYLASEDGDVFVLKAGKEFEMLSINPVGEVCMATPAISHGMLIVRGEKSVFAFARGAGKGTAEGARRPE